MYNLMSLDEFAASCPGLHWREFLAGGDIAESTMGELVAMQPSFFTEVSALLTEDRLPAWRAWARWKVINSLSPYLSNAFVEENFRFYGTVLMGTPELRERWKRGVALVEGSLGEAVGQDLRRPPLLAGRQAADGSAGGQPDRGVPALHHRS